MMIKIQKTKTPIVSIIILAILLLGCSGDYTPKPTGYIRFDLPEKSYRTYSDSCPYSFEISEYVKISEKKSKEPCWKNLYIKPCKATIHLSYKKVNDNLGQLLEDSHAMVYNHTVKADAIEEQVFLNPVKKVYGILYEIKGDAASNIQFIATDSIDNYIRGSLYFDVAPNEDSLAPLIQFAREDIVHMIETLNWE